MRSIRVFAIALVTFAVACTPSVTTRTSPTHYSRNRIETAELVTASASPDLYAAVARLRPSMLHVRDQENPPLVTVNGVRMVGGLNALHSLSPRDVESITLVNDGSVGGPAELRVVTRSANTR